MGGALNDFLIYCFVCFVCFSFPRLSPLPAGMGIFVRCFFSMFRCFLCGRLLRRPSICCTVSGDRQVAAPRYFEGHGWFGRSLIYSFPVMAAARLRKYLVFILVRVVFAYLFLFFFLFSFSLFVSNGVARGRRVQSLLR